MVPGLSWVAARLSRSAVRAGDGRGDQGDVGVVEGAQHAGEVDGDGGVAEAGGDAQDAGLGAGAAEPVAVEGGDGGFPVDPGVGMAGVAGAGVDVAGDEVGPGQPGVVGGDQLGGGGVAGEALAAWRIRVPARSRGRGAGGVTGRSPRRRRHGRRPRRRWSCAWRRWR